jgi:hypothetical protein
MAETVVAAPATAGAASIVNQVMVRLEVLAGQVHGLAADEAPAYASKAHGPAAAVAVVVALTVAVAASAVAVAAEVVVAALVLLVEMSAKELVKGIRTWKNLPLPDMNF